MQFKLTQNFDREGYASGFSVTIEGKDINEINVLSREDLEMELDNLEILRNALLTTNFTTNSNYRHLLSEINEGRRLLDIYTNALTEARKQYETLQAFLSSQGIKELPNFPVFGIPQLEGEFIEKKQESEF